MKEETYTVERNVRAKAVARVHDAVTRSVLEGVGPAGVCALCDRKLSSRMNVL